MNTRSSRGSPRREPEGGRLHHAGGGEGLLAVRFVVAVLQVIRQAGAPEVDLQRPLPRQAGDHGLLAAVR